MSFDWKSLVGSVAPVIATALGGPLAGAAVKAIAVAVTGDENANEKQIAKVLETADPEILFKLKEADQTFELKMAELGVNLETLAKEDRSSARDMHTATRGWSISILSGVTVAGFFAVVIYVLTGEVGLDSTMLGFVLGQVSAKAEQVYNFHFGSSAGSKEKTYQLTNRSK